MSEPSPEQRQRRLRRQIERIIDEGTGKTRQVVVRMTSPAQDKISLVKIASEAVRQRNMAPARARCFRHRSFLRGATR